mgnify:CR=1 FL=1
MMVGLTRWRFFFFFQAEDGLRDLVRSRGLGYVYNRQDMKGALAAMIHAAGALDRTALRGRVVGSLSLINI